MNDLLGDQHTCIVTNQGNLYDTQVSTQSQADPRGVSLRARVPPSAALGAPPPPDGAGYREVPLYNSQQGFNDTQSYREQSFQPQPPQLLSQMMALISSALQSNADDSINSDLATEADVPLSYIESQAGTDSLIDDQCASLGSDQSDTESVQPQKGHVDRDFFKKEQSYREAVNRVFQLLPDKLMVGQSANVRDGYVSDGTEPSPVGALSDSLYFPMSPKIAYDSKNFLHKVANFSLRKISTTVKGVKDPVGLFPTQKELMFPLSVTGKIYKLAGEQWQHFQTPTQLKFAGHNSFGFKNPSALVPNQELLNWSTPKTGDITINEQAFKSWKQVSDLLLVCLLL